MKISHYPTVSNVTCMEHGPEHVHDIQGPFFHDITCAANVDPNPNYPACRVLLRIGIYEIALTTQQAEVLEASLHAARMDVHAKAGAS